GETLADLLGRGRLAPAEACRIAQLAALGLAQLQASGRPHGDVRPGNLLLEPVAGQPPNVKLLFDACQTPGPMELSDQQPGSRLANMPDYVARELMTRSGRCDALCDVYALGCMLYEMLGGTPPFAGGSLQQKLTRHAKEAIRPLDTMGVPPAIGQIV